jgi:uncharacterized membrane protein
VTGRLRALWLRLGESLWLVPAVLTALAVALAFLTTRLDVRLLASGRARELWFVFGVGAEGVRGVLAAIAGSIITVTGVVFSVTIVALQLASTQFTPRVLRSFLEDRLNHLVLGVFVATFTYALLILRTVRAESERVPAFVPSVSVTVAMGLALASIGFLLFFVHHVAHSIRASTIIDRLTADAVATARRAFPREIGEPAPGGAPLGTDPTSERAPPGAPRLVRTERRGYLQLVDEDGLLRLAEFGEVVVRMEGGVGDYFQTGDVLASVWAAEADPRAGRALDDRVRAAFTLGPEPTGPQDVRLGISQLADVAVKALSPGINDPTTAAMCIDGIGEVLAVLGRREAPAAVRQAEGGTVALIARRPDYDELVALAFAPLRHYGAGAPAIAVRLLETMERVGAQVPAARWGVLAREAAHVARTAEAAIADAGDRERVHAAAERALGRLAPPPALRSVSG